MDLQPIAGIQFRAIGLPPEILGQMLPPGGLQFTFHNDVYARNNLLERGKFARPVDQRNARWVHKTSGARPGVTPYLEGLEMLLR